MHPSCWLVAKLCWWKREKKREREKYGNDVRNGCGIPQDCVTELTVQESLIGPFTKKSPSSHLCSYSAGRRLTSSRHISAWLSEDHPPNRPQISIISFSSTSQSQQQRPSTHSWEGNGGRDTDIANNLSKRNPAIFNRGPRFPRQSEHRRLFGEEFSLPFSFKLAEAVSR